MSDADDQLPKELKKVIGQLSAQTVIAAANRLASLVMNVSRAGFGVAYVAIGEVPDQPQSTADMAAPETTKVMVVALAAAVPLAVLSAIADNIYGLAQDARIDTGASVVAEFRSDDKPKEPTHEE